MGPDAAVSEDICDSLNRRRNTMLPKVKTPKTGDDFIDFREMHVRGNFDASIGSVAVPERANRDRGFGAGASLGTCSFTTTSVLASASNHRPWRGSMRKQCHPWRGASGRRTD